jgi:hypothetical protein
MALHAEVAFWGDKFHVTVSIGATIACDRDMVGTITGRAERALAQSRENRESRGADFSMRNEREKKGSLCS